MTSGIPRRRRPDAIIYGDFDEYPMGVCMYAVVYGVHRPPRRWTRFWCVVRGHRWGARGIRCKRCGRCRCLLFAKYLAPRQYDFILGMRRFLPARARR